MNPSYNDSFGSFAQPTAAISDGKSKKRWIITGIVFIILALLAVVIAVFIGGGKIKTGFTSQEKYLNYIVNGNIDDNNNVEKVLSGEQSSFLEKSLLSDEVNISYYDKLINLLNDLKLPEDSVDYKEQMEYLKMFKIYKIMEETYKADTANASFQSGAEGLKNELRELLDSLNGNANSNINSFKRSADSYYQSLVQVVDFLLKNGCSSVRDSESCVPDGELQSVIDGSDLFLENTERYVYYSIRPFLELAEKVAGDGK